MSLFQRPTVQRPIVRRSIAQRPIVQRLTGYRNASLEVCIETVAAGEMSAAPALLERLKPLFQACTKAYAPRLDGAGREDLAQQAACWLWTDLEDVCRRFDPGRSKATTFFYREIRLRCSRAWRTMRRDIAAPLDSFEDDSTPELVSGDPDAERLMEKLGREEALRVWIKGLPSDNGRIVEEHMLGELSGAEIGEQLGLSPAAVFKRVERLKSDLADHLRREGLLALGLCLLATRLFFWFFPLWDRTAPPW